MEKPKESDTSNDPHSTIHNKSHQSVVIKLKNEEITSTNTYKEPIIYNL